MPAPSVLQRTTEELLQRYEAAVARGDKLAATYWLDELGERIEELLSYRAGADGRCVCAVCCGDAA